MKTTHAIEGLIIGAFIGTAIFLIMSVPYNIGYSKAIYDMEQVLNKPNMSERKTQPDPTDYYYYNL